MEEIHYLLGNKCNLNCDFCFWDIRMPDVSFELKKKIIDQIAKIGTKRITISGGEPLCADNFLDILNYAHQNNLEIILHTNGLKINRDMARKIAPLISRISLTLDSIDENIIVAMRQEKKIIKHTIFLIKLFNKLNVSVSVKTLITKINHDEIINIGETLKEMPLQYWSLLQFNPINRGNINKDKFLISEDRFNDICLKVKERFSSLLIKIHKFNNDKNQYCFIASNGDVYTYTKDKGDVKIGDLKTQELAQIISKIKN